MSSHKLGVTDSYGSLDGGRATRSRDRRRDTTVSSAFGALARGRPWDGGKPRSNRCNS